MNTFHCLSTESLNYLSANILIILLRNAVASVNDKTINFKPKSNESCWLFFAVLVGWFWWDGEREETVWNGLRDERTGGMKSWENYEINKEFSWENSIEFEVLFIQIKWLKSLTSFTQKSSKYLYGNIWRNFHKHRQKYIRHKYLYTYPLISLSFLPKRIRNFLLQYP